MTMHMLVLFTFACILKEYLNPKWCQTISNSPQKFGTLIFKTNLYTSRNDVDSILTEMYYLCTSIYII